MMRRSRGRAAQRPRRCNNFDQYRSIQVGPPATVTPGRLLASPVSPLKCRTDWLPSPSTTTRWPAPGGVSPFSSKKIQEVWGHCVHSQELTKFKDRLIVQESSTRSTTATYTRNKRANPEQPHARELRKQASTTPACATPAEPAYKDARPRLRKQASHNLAPERLLLLLLVVGWLLVVGCWLLVVGCWLLGVGCWVLGVVCCVLCVVCCVLCVVCCVL